MITNAGLNLLRNWMYGDSVNALSHIAVGTGGAAPQATDTTLETEVVRKVFGALSKGSVGIARPFPFFTLRGKVANISHGNGKNHSPGHTQ